MKLGARARRALSAAFVLTAFAFLGAYVVANLGELRAFPWTPRPVLMIFSGLLNMAALFWGVVVWKLLLRRFGVRVPFPTLARVWFLSALGRYIPGKIWQFVGAAHLGAGAGLPATVAVTSLALHAGVFLLAALAVAVYLVPAGVGDLGGVALEPLRWLAPLLVTFVHPAVLRRALSLFERFARRPIAGWSGSWWDGVLLFVLALGGWVVNGLALHLFLASLVPLPATAALDVVGINALAFLVGYAVFIAPAGVGAKEGAMAALLALLVPLPVAALLAVAARLWSVTTEILPALVLLRSRGPGSRSAEEAAATAPRVDSP